MKQAEFELETINWVDRFLSTYDREPDTYAEFIQFCMDTLVDEGSI